MKLEPGEELLRLGIGVGVPFAITAVEKVRDWWNREWQIFRWEDILAWQSEQSKLFAREVVKALQRKDPQVRLEGSVVWEQMPFPPRPFGQTFSELFHSEPVREILSIPKIVRTRKALFGLDGKEYQPWEVSTWESRATKALLSLRLEELRAKRKQLLEGTIAPPPANPCVEEKLSEAS